MLSYNPAISLLGIVLAMVITIYIKLPFVTMLEVNQLFPMLDSVTNLTHIIVFFATVIHAVALLAGLLSHFDDTPKIPHDIIVEMVLDTIRKHKITTLSQKRQLSGLGDPNPWMMPNLIEYNRERAKKCIMDDC